MINEELKVLGLIGIRSGSKGLPDKNIKPLAGKPLVAWIIETAKKTNFINRLIVSTDSEHYASMVREFGAETPCLRPSDISSDTSTDYEFVCHMLEWLSVNEGYQPDIIFRLMATCPLQAAEDIDASVELLINDGSLTSTVVAAPARQHPMKALKLKEDDQGEQKYLVDYFTGSGRDVTPVTRQTYDSAYFRSNVITSWRTTITESDSLTGDRVGFTPSAPENSLDIDDEFDFRIAELLLKHPLKEDEAE